MNAFDDFQNHFISDVTNGKTQEITDLVMQQENDFCNNLTNAPAQQPQSPLFDPSATNKANMMMQHENLFNEDLSALNNLNNNRMNLMDDVQEEEEEPQQMQQQEEPQNVVLLNDNNNNSNQFDTDFGPETDVDAIDEDVHFAAGEKEKVQQEKKETEDFIDHGAVLADPFMSANAAENPTIFGSLENKIFEELSLHNPDLIKGNNPFAIESNDDLDQMIPAEYIDNKLIDNIEFNGDAKDEKHDKQVDFSEKKDFSFDREDFAKDVSESAAVEAAVDEELLGANAVVQEDESKTKAKGKKIVLINSINELITVDRRTMQTIHAKYKRRADFAKLIFIGSRSY